MVENYFYRTSIARDFGETASLAMRGGEARNIFMFVSSRAKVHAANVSKKRRIVLPSSYLKDLFAEDHIRGTPTARFTVFAFVFVCAGRAGVCEV